MLFRSNKDMELTFGRVTFLLAGKTSVSRFRQVLIFHYVVFRIGTPILAASLPVPIIKAGMMVLLL